MSNGDYTLEDTIYLMFTTRAFATGIPTVLAGSPVVSAYENDSVTQITAGITLGVSHDSVVGMNLLTIAATAANGYEAGKDYSLVITTGTVDSVSVVGEVVGHFSLSRSAAAVDLANGTDGLGAIKTDTAAILVDTGTTLDGKIDTIDTNVDAILVDTGTTLENHLTDIKGTGFVKDTHSLIDIETYVDILDDVTSGNAKIATDVAAVLVDTAEIGVAGAGLTNINLPNQTMDITGNITGNLSGSVGSVTGAVGSVTGSVGSVVGHTAQTGDSYALANGASGFVAIKTDTATLLGRITSTLFTGITSLAEWLGLIAGKQTGDATARTEMRATGAGSGTFDETTDSQEAIRDTAPLGTAMRGTDSAALATVCTEVRLAELDGANIPADVDGLTTTLGVAGAGLTDLGGMSTTMKGQVNTEADTALTDYDPPTKTEMDSAFTEIKGATWAAGTDTLEHIRDKETDIEMDTAEIGASGAGLTEAGGTGDHLTALPWNAAWDAEVESEVNDAIDTAIAELGVGVPTATPTLRTGMMLMYMALRNKLVTQTSGTDALEIHNDAGTKIASKTFTDDGSDYSEAKMT